MLPNCFEFSVIYFGITMYLKNECDQELCRLSYLSKNWITSEEFLKDFDDIFLVKKPHFKLH